MRKFSQFSLVDFLTNILPSEMIRKDTPNPNAVQKLYSIWKDPANKIGNKIYKQPKDISQRDLDELVSHGLVQRTGSGLQMTNKGSNIIKIMILGDNRSAFEMKGKKDIDYVTASTNIKMARKQRVKNKKVADLWWNING